MKAFLRRCVLPVTYRKKNGKRLRTFIVFCYLSYGISSPFLIQLSFKIYRMAENSYYCLKYLLHNPKTVPAKNEKTMVPMNQSYKHYSVCCGYPKFHVHLSVNIMLEHS